MTAHEGDNGKLVRFSLGRGGEVDILVRSGCVVDLLGAAVNIEVAFDVDGVLRSSPSLPPAWRGLGLAAVFRTQESLPLLTTPATFRTTAGPREVRRRGRFVHVEYPAPLVWRVDERRGTALDALRRLGLEPCASMECPAPCFLDLDGVVLAAALRDAKELSTWKPASPVKKVLEDAGCCCLLLCHAAGGRVLVRSWLGDGREDPSPLAAGAAASLTLAATDRKACQVCFENGLVLPVRLRRDGRRIHRLTVGLLAR